MEMEKSRPRIGPRKDTILLQLKLAYFNGASYPTGAGPFSNLIEELGILIGSLESSAD